MSNIIKTKIHSTIVVHNIAADNTNKVFRWIVIWQDAEKCDKTVTLKWQKAKSKVIDKTVNIDLMFPVSKPNWGASHLLLIFGEFEILTTN